MDARVSLLHAFGAHSEYVEAYLAYADSVQSVLDSTQAYATLGREMSNVDIDFDEHIKDLRAVITSIKPMHPELISEINHVEESIGQITRAKEALRDAYLADNITLAEGQMENLDVLITEVEKELDIIALKAALSKKY